MGETASVRLPDDLLEDIAALAADEGVSRSDFLRDAVQRGIAAKRLELAIARYRAGRVSLGRAAEIAALPLTSFLDEAQRAGVLLKYGPDELAEDLAWARRK